MNFDLTYCVQDEMPLFLAVKVSLRIELEEMIMIIRKTLSVQFKEEFFRS